MDFAASRALLARRQEERMELGLERLRALLRRLGDPQEKYRSILVAGTNGKGSTCALLEAALREAGFRSGLTTSPHLFSVTERVRVDGRAVSEAAFARAFSKVVSAETEPLSYFELATAAAFVAFADAGVEAAVLEVGLGGRLDAVNVVRSPVLSIISSIGYDHTAQLGGTLTAIAREKAGIFRRGRPALAGRVPAEALASLKREARFAGAKLHALPGKLPFSPGPCDWAAGVQRLKGPGGLWPIGLLGRRQALNASLVRKAAALLSKQGLTVDDAALRRAFASVVWPGRFSVVREGRSGRTFVLDGGHNGEAARSFAETWSRSPWAEEGRFVLGLLKDKDPEALLEPLAPYMKEALVCAPASPRALAAAALAAAVRRWAPACKVRVFQGPAQALAAVPRGRSAAVAGSFYLVAQAWRALEPGALPRGWGA